MKQGNIAVCQTLNSAAEHPADAAIPYPLPAFGRGDLSVSTTGRATTAGEVRIVGKDAKHGRVKTGVVKARTIKSTSHRKRRAR